VLCESVEEDVPSFKVYIYIYIYIYIFGRTSGIRRDGRAFTRAVLWMLETGLYSMWWVSNKCGEQLIVSEGDLYSCVCVCVCAYVQFI